MDTRNCVYLVYLAGNPGNDGGWEHWENDSEESKPKEVLKAGLAVNTWGSVLQGTSERLRNSPQTTPKKNKEVGLFTPQLPSLIV